MSETHAHTQDQVLDEASPLWFWLSVIFLPHLPYCRAALRFVLVGFFDALIRFFLVLAVLEDVGASVRESPGFLGL